MTLVQTKPTTEQHVETEPPLISVIVPVHNDKANLVRCLDALATSRFTGYEVIIMDDASTDDTPDVAERMGARVIRLEKNLGPAGARNLGAEYAKGEFLQFIDADVCVNEETLARVAETFEKYPDADAVFGSYCNAPDHRGLFSQYRNLFHHYVHQDSNPEATTFWSGCGAIRKSVFLEHGGFDVNYARPCIEDIELGVRLHNAGHRIVLNRDVQATHLKHWTFWKMIKTDIFDRGVPWTQLMLAQGSMPNDLNLRISQRVSALCALAYVVIQTLAIIDWPVTALLPLLAIVGVLAADYWRVRRFSHKPLRRAFEFTVLALFTVGSYFSGWWSVYICLPLFAIILLNLRFYRFFVKNRSLTFTMFVVPLHVMYYLYSILAYGIGMYTHLRGKLYTDTSERAGLVNE
ncbi:MAG: glycosyltransferase family 2 protein [Planctomycetota bacterium]